MNTVCSIDKCNGCMACIDKCPKSCITIEDNIYSYNAVKNMNICINCGQCEKICPNNVLTEKMEPIIWKQGWAASGIRSNSSSGGVASEIIRLFIEAGGYVASCLFEDGQFIFDITNNEERAKCFAGSKYVKSNPEGIYKKIQERLKTDNVLFIGLPCQVAGIKNYVNVKNQEKLFTIDLICHGTPSPKVLEKFLEDKKINIRNCYDIKFRTNTKFGLKDGSKVITPEGTDDYLLTFLDAIIYTDNCYLCQFAELHRISDITLGDSRGTEYTDEEKNGVSLILVQTDKGKELLSHSNLTLREVDKEIAIRDNHQLRHPCVEKPERKIFLKKIIQGKSYSRAVFPFYKKFIIKRNIKKVLIKLHLYKNHS